MRSFILTILILGNIVGGIEVASDINDVWADFGVLASEDGLQANNTDDGGEPLESSDCDHCCHSGAHLAGFIVAAQVLSFDRDSLRIPFADNYYQFAGTSPPTPPPNV